MEKVRWRGTWGVGDAMQALNVCHNYCNKNNVKVNLEMHWEHDDNHLTHPDDPETIIQRMEWIHTQYHRQNDVVITHVYNSDLFPSGNLNPDKDKHRFYFDSKSFRPNSAPPNDWIFKKSAFIKSPKKVVYWTPVHNSEPPRRWKRFLTNDDWYDIIKLLSGEGWIPVELTYRTPIDEAFKEIQEADIVVCYDGMWHFIARNFAKPMFVPSWEGITNYNTPNAVKRKNREEVKKFFNKFPKGVREMRDRALRHKVKIERYYHED